MALKSTKTAIQIVSDNWSPGGVTSLYIGDQLMKKWKIRDQATLSLRFGASKHTVKAVRIPRSSSLRMGQGLARSLGLSSGQTMRAQYQARSNTVRLGPVMAVMLGRPGKLHSSTPFGSTTSFCRELSEAFSTYGGLVYFFCADDWQAGSATVRGIAYANGWHQGDFPLPDAVYNRLMSRKLENKPSVQHFMREVKSKYGTVTFNEKYLDKTEVFSALGRAESCRKYLPESHSFRNYAMLKAMTGKYSTVFLKPVRGSLGKGIIRIVRKPGGYSCQHSNVNGTVTRSYKSLSKLFASISGTLKSRTYQIQRGLQLIRIGGRPVDFRALTHKDQNGKWGVTSIVARIAGQNHFVSNVARGGQMSKAGDALKRANLSKSSVVRARLDKAALDIAAGIDAQMDGHFGELGIDLAVETSGRVWLLEVNSKPAKNDDTPLSEGKVRPSVKKLAMYARHLSGL